MKRAAELQTASPDPSPRGQAVASGDDSGYEVDQIRRAAAEAGIAPEFFAAALAEADAASAASADGVGALATTFHGTAATASVVSRRFDRPVDEVYAAVSRVLGRHRLVLLDSYGDPLGGDRLVYGLPFPAPPADGAPAPAAGGWEPPHEVSIRLLPLDRGRCVATLSASSNLSWRARVGAAAAIAGGSGIVGGWAAGAIGAALMLNLPVTAAVAAAGIGGAVLLGAGAAATAAIAGSRAAFRSSQRRTAAVLERLLQLVNAEVGRE